jgi:hypothetical protein
MIHAFLGSFSINDAGLHFDTDSPDNSLPKFRHFFIPKTQVREIKSSLFVEILHINMLFSSVFDAKNDAGLHSDTDQPIFFFCKLA